MIILPTNLEGMRNLITWFLNLVNSVGAFPNEDSLLRQVGTILMDINEEWITGSRYLSMEEE